MSTSRLFLLMLCMGMGLFAYFSSDPKKSPPVSTVPLIAESMSGVHAQRYDKGRVIQDIRMQSWRHYKDETTTQMTFPSLRAYHPDGRIWDISAEQGEGFQAQLAGKFDKLHLSRNVIVQQLGQHSDFWWEMKTENLLFFPNQPIALTDDPVVVTGPGVHVSAKGLRAYLERHEIEFLKEVQCQAANLKPQAIMQGTHSFWAV